jgi:tight adherence protein C
MGIVVFSFAVIFLLIVSGGLLLFYRQAVFQRIASVVTPDEKNSGFLNSMQRSGFSVDSAVAYIGQVLPRTEAETSVVEKRLVRAGYRKPSAIRIFYSAKLIVPLSLCFVAWVTGVGNSSPFFVYTTALALGFLLPDFWLGRMISTRQMKIRLGLPDVLDFLVICIEAGLSMDQATARTAEELKISHPAVSDELDLVVLEQRAGRARSDAWKQFAERTDVDRFWCSPNNWGPVLRRRFGSTPTR